MKTSKPLTLFLALSLSCYCLLSFAQEQQPDAIYKDLVKEYILNKDGNWDYHYSHKLQLLTHYAFHTLYGEDFIIHNPTYQKLKINHSVTTMADGKVVHSPDNAYNELLPSFAVNAPAFNAIREMAVTHTGLEKGAVIDLDYTISSSKEYSLALSGNEGLWMNSPVEKMTLIIRVPKGINLHFNQYNFIEKPVITQNSGEVTYKWTLKDLPAATREDFRPREQQNRPRIVFSTARNFSKLLQSFQSQEAFSYSCEGFLKDKVKGILEGNKNALQSVLAIQDFVANEIIHHPVPLSAAAFRARPANEVFLSNGGTEIEKAVLLTAMLKEAGFPAELTLVIPEKFFDSRSSNLLQAERFLVKCSPDQMDPLYLSPLQNDLYDQVFNLSGKTVIHLKPGKSPETDHIRNSIPEIELSGNMEVIDNKDLKGTLHLSATGKLNPYLKLTQDSTHLKKLLAGIFEPGEIKTCKMIRLEKEMLKAEFEIHAEGKIRNLSDHYFLKIPTLTSISSGWYMNELVTHRLEPLEIPFPVSETYRYTITLPEGIELITAEDNVNLQKGFGRISMKTSQEGRALEIARSLSLMQPLIGQTEYESFRSFINTWNNRKYREFILRVGPK